MTLPSKFAVKIKQPHATYLIIENGRGVQTFELHKNGGMTEVYMSWNPASIFPNLGNLVRSEASILRAIQSEKRSAASRENGKKGGRPKNS